MVFNAESSPEQGPVISSQGSSSNGCCLFSYHHGTFFVRLSFPTLSIGKAVEMCDTESVGNVRDKRIRVGMYLFSTALIIIGIL